MTYIVNDNCIRCKTMDCVEVCPVDCFYEGENMLVIHPDECIDCSVCEPECPVNAIKADTEPGLEKWLSLNAEYAKIWPNITVKKRPHPTGRRGTGSRTNSNIFHPSPERGLNEGLDSQHDSGVDPVKRISNTKASRTAAEREEYDRINAHLDQALELTFPCSDPVAITINGYDVFRREAAIDFAGKREPVTRSKVLRGRA